jgi:hypothetical protein
MGHLGTAAVASLSTSAARSASSHVPVNMSWCPHGTRAAHLFPRSTAGISRARGPAVPTALIAGERDPRALDTAPDPYLTTGPHGRGVAALFNGRAS